MYVVRPSGKQQAVYLFDYLNRQRRKTFCCAFSKMATPSVPCHLARCQPRSVCQGIRHSYCKEQDTHFVYWLPLISFKYSIPQTSRHIIHKYQDTGSATSEKPISISTAEYVTQTLFPLPAPLSEHILKNSKVFKQYTNIIQTFFNYQRENWKSR